MTESVLDYMSRLGRDARAASRLLARAAAAQKNRALLAAAVRWTPPARSCPTPTSRTSPPSAPMAWSRRCWTAWR